jgi:hypothetical protein
VLAAFDHGTWVVHRGDSPGVTKFQARTRFRGAGLHVRPGPGHDRRAASVVALRRGACRRQLGGVVGERLGGGSARPRSRTACRKTSSPSGGRGRYPPCGRRSTGSRRPTPGSWTGGWRTPRRPATPVSENAAAAFDNDAKSKQGKREGKRAGMPRRKSKHKARPGCRFTTGTIRVDSDRGHVTPSPVGDDPHPRVHAQAGTTPGPGHGPHPFGHRAARAGTLVRVLPGAGQAGTPTRGPARCGPRHRPGCAAPPGDGPGRERRTQPRRTRGDRHDWHRSGRRPGHAPRVETPWSRPEDPHHPTQPQRRVGAGRRRNLRTLRKGNKRPSSSRNPHTSVTSRTFPPERSGLLISDHGISNGAIVNTQVNRRGSPEATTTSDLHGTRPPSTVCRPPPRKTRGGEGKPRPRPERCFTCFGRCAPAPTRQWRAPSSRILLVPGGHEGHRQVCGAADPSFPA